MFHEFSMKLGESSELRVSPVKLDTGGVGLSLRKFVKTADKGMVPMSGVNPVTGKQKAVALFIGPENAQEFVRLFVLSANGKAEAPKSEKTPKAPAKAKAERTFKAVAQDEVPF